MLKNITRFLLTVIAGWASPLQAQELAVDTSAPASQQPTIDQGANNVPIVNITTPSPGGVSHNTFKEYNVDRQGIVFNNNHDHDPSPEHGLNPSHLTQHPLLINENLQGRAADIILTEVSGSHPSNLWGLTEIYGQAADFILANPHGIYCDGAGFINAYRITLTTGQPQFDVNGALKALKIDQGTIEIKGGGLSTSLPGLPASPIDILSRAAKISASLWARGQAVNIYTGSNTFDYQNRTLTPHPAAQKDKPYLAIDAALVGNVSAKKITLIATEKGVGVNCPDLSADADNIEITAEGTIQLKNIPAAQDLIVESHEADIKQEASTTLVKGDLTLKAPQGAICLASEQLYTQGSAQIVSKNLTIQAPTNFQASPHTTHCAPTLALHVQDTLINQGQLTTPSLAATPMQHLDNQGIICTQKDLHLTAQTFHNAGDLVVTAGSVKLTAPAGLQNKKLIASTQHLTITTQKELSNHGQLQAGQQLTLTAHTLHNQGEITSQEEATIQAKAAIHNNNNIRSTQGLQINGGPLYNAGSLTALRELTLATQAIHNTGAITSQTGNITLTAQEHIHNQHLINSAQALHIQAHQALTNQGTLAASHLLQVNALAIDNHGTIASRQSHVRLAAQEHIYNEKTMVGARDLHISAQGPVTNQGQLKAHQDLTVQGQALTNTGQIRGGAGNTTLVAQHRYYNPKAIISQGNLHIQAHQLDNPGTITTHQALQATTHSIHNSGQIQSSAHASLNAQEAIYNEKTITSDQSLTLAAAQLTNKQQLNTPHTLQITTQALHNQGQLSAATLITQGTYDLHNAGTIQTQNDLTLNTQALHNQGEIITKQGNLFLQAQGKLHNEQAIASAKNLSIDTKQEIVNHGRLTSNHDLAISAQSLTNTAIIDNQASDITITTQSFIDNQQTIASKKALSIQAAQLTNTGQLTAADTLKLETETINNQGNLVGAATTLIAQGDIQNEQAIFSTSSLHLATKQALHNRGQVTAENELNIDAQTLHNQGKISSNTGNARLAAQSNIDNQGTLSSAHHLTLIAQELDNQGQVFTPVLTATPLQQLHNAGTIQTQNDLSLTTQSLHNIGHIVVQAGNLALTAHKSFHNTHVISSAQDLAIQTQQNLQNQGEITAGANTSLEATGKVHNEKTITSTQNLHIQTQQAITNNGQLKAHQDLQITARAITNNGTITGGQGSTTLTAQDSIANTNTLSSNGSLHLAAHQIANQAQISAHDHLAIKSTYLHNQGQITSAKSAHLVAQNSLYNAKQIATAQLLQLATGRLTNHGPLTTDGELVLTAQHLDNQGTIAAQASSTLHVQGNITNASTLSSAQNLHIQAKGKISNHGSITVADQLSLTAQHLDNHGHIAGGGKHTTLTLAHTLNNPKTITSTQQLSITAQNSIHNTGNITSGTDLTLQAPNINNQGSLQGKKGSITLQASNTLANSQPITSTQDLHITTHSLKNTVKLAAIRNLHITTQNLTNQGEITGGQGTTTLQAQDYIHNNHLIASAQGLYIQANLLANNAQLTASQALAITTQSLTNKGHITGGQGATTLQATHQLENQNTITSAQDLSLQARTLTNQGQVAAMHNLQVKAHNLANTGEIQGGSGQTTLKAQKAMHNASTITSEHDLSLEATDLLKNDGKIAAAHNLKITAGTLQNSADSEVAGGKGTTQLQTQRDITNQGSIASEKDLIIAAGHLDNAGMVQATADLTIAATQVTNQSRRAIFAGKNMTMQLADRLYNEQGEIFAQGHMTLQGQHHQPARKIENYVGRIEAMGDITIKAQELKNIGRVTGANNYRIKNTYRGSWCTYASSDWIRIKSTYGNETYGEYHAYTYDEYDKKDGWSGAQFYKWENEPVSTMQTEPAHIQARANLHLEVTQQIHNYGSVITAGANVYVGSTAYTAQVPNNQRIQGTYINNETPSKEVYIPDAYIYQKTWIHKEGVALFWRKTKTSDCIRKYREPRTFTLHAQNSAIFQAGHHMHIQARELKNGPSITSLQVAQPSIPQPKLQETQTISVTPHITPPTAQHGLFKLNLTPPSTVNASTTTQPAHSLAVPASFPTPSPYTTPAVASTAAPTPQPNMSTPAAYVPQTSPLHQPTPPATPTQPADELPAAPTTTPPTADLAATIATYSLPPATTSQPHLPTPAAHHYLYETNVKVDQAQFYGSPYFLKKTAIIDKIDRPLRFLGDPFYESRLINDAILQATNRPYLHDGIATPEEQVKYLIDNTAEATQDLNLALGVALSKEQINTLRKDILWYVKETVHGQQVLTPQVYLSKATIQALQSPAATGIHSQGTLHLALEKKLTNTGNITAKNDLQVNAGTIRNETLGPTQATLQSTAGTAAVQAKNDLHNLSGQIAGAQGLHLASQHGNISNKTKVNHDGTALLPQASIASGADLVVKAEKGDFVNTASRVKATGNSDIQARDVLFETQALKHQTRSHSASTSHSSGILSSSPQTTTTTHTHTTTTQAGCELAIGGNAKTKATRDIKFVSGDVNVGGDANFDAGRHFEARTAEEVQEDHYHHETHAHKSGLFSSASHSQSHDVKTKQVKQRGTSFNTGGKMGIRSGRNTNFIGANVAPDEVDIDAQGNLNIRAAYNSTHTEENHTTDTQNSALFGLLKDNQGQDQPIVKGGTKATGNTWQVNKLKAHGQQGVDTEKMAVRGRDSQRAKTVAITSTQGNVRDHAAMEKSYDTTTQKTYTEKQGLLGVSYDKNKDRWGLKLYEKHRTKTEKEEEATHAQASSYLVEDMAVKSTTGKVTLEGTDLNASQDVLLSGEKGVDILDAVEETHHSEHTETKREELSLGVKNKFLAAYRSAQALQAAKDQLVQATQAYSNFKQQLAQAKTHLKAGEITQKAYDELSADQPLHLAAISAATLSIAAKTKQFTSTAVDALGSTSTGGFSLDTEAAIERTMQHVLSQKSTAKEANIQGRNITIESAAGDGNLLGSHLNAAENLTLDVENFTATASVNTLKETSSADSNTTTLTTEVPFSSLGATTRMATQGAIDLNHTRHHGEGNKNGKDYNYAGMRAQNIHLQVRGDMTLAGANAHAEQNVAGFVKGNVNVTTLQDSYQEKNTTHDTSVGLSLGKDLVSPHLGKGATHSQTNSQAPSQLSSFTSGNQFNLAIEGTLTQIGAPVGSETTGQAGIKAQGDIIKKDLLNQSHTSHTGRQAHLGSRHLAGASSYIHQQQAHASMSHGTHHSLSKLSCDSTEKVLYNTSVDLSLDTDALQVAADPVKAGKTIARDVKALYSAAEGVVETFQANAKDENGQRKLGTRGVLKGLQHSLEDAAGLHTTAKDPATCAVINNATETTPAALAAAANQEAHKLQARAGAQDPANVTLYQGQDPQLADSPLKNYQAGYNTHQNHIYLNTQATDLNQGGNIMASLHHEAQRKENHDNPCLRPLSEAQQTNLAHFRGNRAQKVWDRLTDSHPNPTTTHAWNHQHQASLAPSNAHVAQARHQDVKPRVLEKLDPRYWQAKASGDEAKAQKLQAGWEKVEPWVPVLGSGVAAFEDFEKGQYVKATLQAGLAATEAIGLGALKKLVTTGAQVGLKQGAKVLEKEAARGGKAGVIAVRSEALVKGASPSLNLSGKSNKLMQHARNWYELAPRNNATKNQITLLENLAKRIHKSPQIIKQGSWRGQISDAFFYSNGKHIVVTKSDGTLITILKNAHKSNTWFKKATIVRK